MRRYTYEYRGYYKILPAIHDWSSDPARIKDGSKVPPDFVYSSNTNADWMSRRRAARLDRRESRGRSATF